MTPTLTQGFVVSNSIFEERVTVFRGLPRRRTGPVSAGRQDIFGEVRPATSMVEVSRLVCEEFHVETEATAVVDP